jgi:hypothetical protein
MVSQVWWDLPAITALRRQKQKDLKSTASLGHKAKMKIKIKARCSRALVAHACNPSYSGGREQEDRGSKPAQANSL